MLVQGNKETLCRLQRWLGESKGHKEVPRLSELPSEVEETGLLFRAAAVALHARPTPGKGF